jgi:hypothetical protein
MVAVAVAQIRTNTTQRPGIQWYLNSTRAGPHSPLRWHHRGTQRPDGTVTGVVTDLPIRVHARPQGQVHRDAMIDRVHPQAGELHPLAARQTHVLRAKVSDPDEISRGFFEQAQTHVGSFAPPALVATSMPGQNARDTSCGMDRQDQPENQAPEGWWTQMGTSYASNGNAPKAASPPAIPSDTGAPDVGNHPMELKRVLEQRKRKPVSPYRHRAWSAELSQLSLLSKYPSIMDGFQFGFELGIPHIFDTFTPPNHSSIVDLPDVYSSIVHNEFVSGRYVGPLTRAQVEAELGPF